MANLRKNSASGRHHWLAVALLGLGLAGPAMAGDPPPPPAGTPSDADMKRAKEMFENGQILYDEGRYEDAITAWEQSYRLSGLADLLFNISGAWERLGNFKDALSALNKYRVYAPASERETLDRRMRALEERQRQAEANAAARPPVDPTRPTETTPTTRPPAKGAPVGPVALVVVGAGGIGFGIVEGLRASSAVSSLKSQCVAGEAGLLCPEGARAASTVRQNAAVMSTVSLAAGGLLTVGGVAWLLVGNASSDIRIAPTLGGLTVDGEF